jgi:Zn-dependent peptidase ImmA (M78 family)/DNA-binding XRE family transcriptional regulator
MRTGPALITPEVARWARERADVSHKRVAESIHAKPEEIRSWESGLRRPTLKQAERLAHTLRIPFGYLFLSSPPVETVPLPDFRTMPVRTRRGPGLSPDLRDVLNDVLVKQEWYRDFLLEEEAEPVALVGRFSLKDDPDEIAGYIRGELAMGELIRQHADPDALLRALIRRIESLGIVIMVSGVVRSDNRRALSPKEFRGFAISDRFAPVIFINGKDARAAQMFTLAHELAHITIGETGISNEYLGETRTDARHEIERFCNKVAAEVLVPREDFSSEWADAAPIDVNLVRLTRRYRVSSLVILRRAFDLGRMDRSTFTEWYSREERQGRKRPPSGGGDFRSTLPVRNSRTLTSAIVRAALGGRLSYREAARFLGVKIGTLPKIATWLRTSD